MASLSVRPCTWLAKADDFCTELLEGTQSYGSVISASAIMTSRGLAVAGYEDYAFR